jgi:hypothetical protein
MVTAGERNPKIMPRPSLARRARRFALQVVGWGLILVGLPLAVLPGHLGAPLMVVGLIVVLRASRQARRRFIGLQRRHPKVVFPIRRLLRRQPEILPVLWQQLLRSERFFLPRRWRRARALRRWLFPRRR